MRNQKLKFYLELHPYSEGGCNLLLCGHGQNMLQSSLSFHAQIWLSICNTTQYNAMFDVRLLRDLKPETWVGCSSYCSYKKVVRIHKSWILECIAEWWSPCSVFQRINSNNLKIKICAKSIEVLLVSDFYVILSMAIKNYVWDKVKLKLKN